MNLFIAGARVEHAGITMPPGTVRDATPEAVWVEWDDEPGYTVPYTRTQVKPMTDPKNIPPDWLETSAIRQRVAREVAYLPW